MKKVSNRNQRILSVCPLALVFRLSDMRLGGNEVSTTPDRLSIIMELNNNHAISCNLSKSPLSFTNLLSLCQMLIPAVSRTIVASACRYCLAYLNNDSSEIQIIDHPEDLGLELLQRTQILSLLQVCDKMVNTFSLIS